MLTLIQNGEVYAPEPLGHASVLLINDKIAKIGDISPEQVASLGLDVDIIDATDCIVAPGFIDPHMHIIGGSGEESFSSRTPDIQLTEIVSWGTTTVVGCLGADVTTRTMAGLLAKAMALKEEGISAFVYSGGYPIPPATLTGSIRHDLLFVEEVIGAGELAISDHRSPQPDPTEIMKVITDAHVGGMLTGKAGVTHFHIGEGEQRLGPVRQLFERYEIQPQYIYLTHIERSEALMDDAIEFAKRGVFVDIDTAAEDLAKWLTYYLEHGGDPGQLTVSSDADSSSPRNLYEQVCESIVTHRLPFEQVLPLVTSNTARVLKLKSKGKLEPRMDADVVVLRAGSLDIAHVIAKGRPMVRDGDVVVRETYLDQSNRTISLHGAKG